MIWQDNCGDGTAGFHGDGWTKEYNGYGASSDRDRCAADDFEFGRVPVLICGRVE